MFLLWNNLSCKIHWTLDTNILYEIFDDGSMFQFGQSAVKQLNIQKKMVIRKGCFAVVHPTDFRINPCIVYFGFYGLIFMYFL